MEIKLEKIWTPLAWHSHHLSRGEWEYENGFVLIESNTAFGALAAEKGLYPNETQFGVLTIFQERQVIVLVMEELQELA